jgi:hypothetical protein
MIAKGLRNCHAQAFLLRLLGGTSNGNEQCRLGDQGKRDAGKGRKFVSAI